MATLSDGLFLHDLDGIADSVRPLRQPSATQIRQAVNRYRLGEQEDYWGKLDIAQLADANRWFTEVEGVKGQERAVEKVCSVLYRARAGLAGMASGTATKPKGILFFAGPPGVGKTLLAKKLAKFLFGTEEAFIRIDMSELKDEHSMSKLIGAPPSYVGYERGGLLTNAVMERPFSVVLFDEIEKAHPKIMDVFLQLLDEGRLTDSKGQTVFFGETVVIFTSNIGNRARDRLRKDDHGREYDWLQAILDDSSLSDDQRVAQVQQHFRQCVGAFFESEISRPELLRRIGDNIVAFNHIRSESVQREILTSHLERIRREFEDRFRHLGHTLEVDTEPVVALLLKKHGHDTMPRFGGGGITNAIEDELIDVLAPEVLAIEDVRRTSVAFHVLARGDDLVVQTT